MHRSYSTAPDWPGSPHESLVVEHSILCSAVNMLIINTQLSGLIMWNRTTITRDQGTNDILTQTRNSVAFNNKHAFIDTASQESQCPCQYSLQIFPVDLIFSSYFHGFLCILWLIFTPSYIHSSFESCSDAHYCTVYCSLGDILSSGVHEAQNIYAELFSLSTHSEWIHTSVSHPTESTLKTCEVPGTSIPYLTITDKSDI